MSMLTVIINPLHTVLSGSRLRQLIAHWLRLLELRRFMPAVQRVPSLAVARRVHGVAQEAVVCQSDGQPASMTGFEGAAVVQLNRSK